MASYSGGRQLDIEYQSPQRYTPGSTTYSGGRAINIDFEAPVPFGEVNQTTVYVYDSTNVRWERANHFMTLYAEKSKNALGIFRITFYDVDSTKKSYIKEDAAVAIFYRGGNKNFLKGYIKSCNYRTHNFCDVEGYSSLIKAGERDIDTLDSATSDSISGIQEYNAVATNTMINELFSIAGDGASPWIIQPNTNENFGDYNARFENTTNLSAVISLINSINYDLYESYTPDFVTNYVNVAADRQNTVIGNTSSRYTFAVSGSTYNSEVTSKERDTLSQIQHITVIGGGDGANQLRTSIYDGSTTYTNLSANITAAATTINIDDTTGFSNGDGIIICEERITVGTVASATQFTGCTRGANSTTAKVHPNDCLVYKYATASTAFKKKTFTDKSILPTDEGELFIQSIASKLLTERRNVVNRIGIRAIEWRTALDYLEPGYRCTVVDSEADLNGTYTVKRIRLNYENGIETCTFEIDNKIRGFEDKFVEIQQQAENISRFYQGSTSIVNASVVENAENTADGYVTVYFHIPTDTVAINSVKLNFRNEKARTYNAAHTHDTTISAGGDHTHPLDGVTSAASNTAEYINQMFATWDVGNTQDTNATPYDFNATVPGAASGTFSGCLMTVGILNRSGATDTFQWDITNVSESTTLDSNRVFSINDDAFQLYNYTFTTSQVSVGDTLRMHIEDGVIGTVAGKTKLGHVFVLIQGKGTHTHTFTGETTDSQTHTHGAETSSSSGGYDINSANYTTNDGDIYYTNDASGVTPTWHNSGISGTWTEGGVNLEDFTTHFTSSGWKGIQLRPNGNSRHYVFMEAKVYIQSKKI